MNLFNKYLLLMTFETDDNYSIRFEIWNIHTVNCGDVMVLNGIERNQEFVVRAIDWTWFLPGPCGLLHRS